jgi:hypothetical protein
MITTAAGRWEVTRFSPPVHLGGEAVGVRRGQLTASVSVAAAACASRIGAIEIVPYDASWPGWFAQVGAGLHNVLGDTAVRIDHVGSGTGRQAGAGHPDLAGGAGAVGPVRRAAGTAGVLLFRDFLRADPDTAKQYAELKLSLATTYRDDRAGYTDAKSDFIWAAIRKADDWAQDVGWEAGPSDA